MPRTAAPLTANEETLKRLRSIAGSRTERAQRVERAKIILELLEGARNRDVAARFDRRPNTIGDLRRRFAAEGLAALDDAARSGRRSKYGADFTVKVLKALEEAPPAGRGRWDAPLLASKLQVPAAAIWKVLRAKSINLNRQRSWCISTDKEFAAKAADIIGLYLAPPENAVVFCIDEKPSIQALERKQGYVQTSSGKLVRGCGSTYKRHGTVNLFAALNVATGMIQPKITDLKRRVDFLAFMDELIAENPHVEGRTYHVILDNYCIHKRCDDWLARHPYVTFHFTPTSASWLNMVEIWFGILSRNALSGASFKNKDDLTNAIKAFVASYNPACKPFVWRKREVKGSQLKNTIVNFEN